MSNKITPYAEKIIEALDSVETQKEIVEREKEKIRKDMAKSRIASLYSLISRNTKSIYDTVKEEKVEKQIVEKKAEVKTFSSRTFKTLTRDEKEMFIEQLNIGYDNVEEFIKEQKKSKGQIKGLKKEDYRIYTPNKWGEVANKYAKDYADRLIDNYPKFFKPLFDSFAKVNMPFLSRTYVSLMLFFTALSIPIGAILFIILNLSFQASLLFVLLVALVSPVITFLGFYFYPRSLEGQIQGKIKREIPFAMVHMGAVAGSGAHPLSIFELLVNSKEYPALKKEFRKVLNLVNLFGYNLTTALKNVAKSTPSKELRELFDGMVTTIETGGDLKAYLNEKSKEALNTYKLDRKKKVEALATYSEIYTALLIAAPLLLIITLAVMNSMGGDLGGFSFSTLAYGSVGVALPLLNIAFMIFIGASQK